jgi:hypothetical protein
MEGVKGVVWSGLHRVAVLLTFGGYHLRLMDEQWKASQDLYKVQEKEAKEMLVRAKKEAVSNRLFFDGADVRV